MKPLQRLMFCIILIALATSFVKAHKWKKRGVKGSGNVVKTERTVTPFTSLKVEGGWNVTLIQGNEHKLVIETDENLVELVKTEVSNGILHIHCDKRIWNRTKMNIYVTFETLKDIFASGGSDVYGETVLQTGELSVSLSGGSDLNRLKLNADRFEGIFTGGSDVDITFESIGDIDITATGGSDVDLHKVVGKTCKIILNGGSDANISGKTGSLILKATGGSDIDGYNFHIEDCKLNLSGSSDAILSVNKTLDVTLSGGSDFSCKGKPDLLNSSICGSCSFQMK